MTAKRVASEVAAFAFYLVLTIVFLWPLPARLATSVSDQGDPLLNTWILNWDCWAFTHQLLHLFAAPIFAPAHLPLAYSEHMTGIALLVYPFYLAGVSPIALHGIASILGITLSGYGAFVLARLVARSTPAALLAGIFHAFVSFRISHFPHVQILWSGWLPLILAALIAFRRNPSRRNAALFAAAFVMNALSNIYFMLFVSVAMLLTIWLFAIAERHDGAYRRRLAGALIVAGLVLLPFNLPYAIVSNEYKMTRFMGEALAGSASWTDWLMPAPNNVLYGPLANPDLERPERQLFPGLLSLMLFAVAIFLTRAGDETAIEPRPPSERRRTLRIIDINILCFGVLAYLGMAMQDTHLIIRNTVIFAYSGADLPLTFMLLLTIVRFTIAIPRALGGGTLRERLAKSRFSVDAWAALVWIAVGFLGSFGRNGFFAEFLFRRTMIFRSLRALARFAVISYVGLAVWMALGIVALLSYVPSATWRRILIAVLFVATLIDINFRVRWEQVNEMPGQADIWLRDHGRSAGGSTLQLPMNKYATMFLYMLGATVHHAPIMNGTSGFEPPVHRKLREMEDAATYNDEFLDTIERNGGALVLVHADWLGHDGPLVSAWLNKNLQNGRLQFVRRFDHDVFGDWLFAVTRNAKIRGVGSDPNLDRFLHGEPTYNAITFGRMDRPRDGDVDKTLTVTGWALSPYGIRSATVLLDAARVRIPAKLTPRDDISRTWPWYPRCPNPAFTAIIPKRPPGVHPFADVQVEIVDGRGVATRFRDQTIEWK